jgi:phosphoenolpyruvate carboxykinase (ATP)
VNTGWTGGSYGSGSRIPLSSTRSIIDSIHSGSLTQTPTSEESWFGLHIPRSCAGLGERLLFPELAWGDRDVYARTARKLARMFQQHFTQYADAASEETLMAGPRC